VHDLIAAGVTHIVLNLPLPWPQAVARWVDDEIIAPVRAGHAPTAPPPGG
jgi:hypothetical protein